MEGNLVEAVWRLTLVLSCCSMGVITPLAQPQPQQQQQQSNVLYPSYRFNQRNFWLEYSTPPSTVFPEYDSDQYDDWRSSTSSAAAAAKNPAGPRFVNPAKRNNTVEVAPLGATVVLDCPLADLADHQVSWFRRKGLSLHVLTVGRETFSADSRYSLQLRRRSKEEEEENWGLRIEHSTREDNGTYICQVSTHPPILLVSHLRVVVPEVRLVDEEDGREISEKHYKPGSTIELHCVVSNYLAEFAATVLWRHKGEVITQTTLQDRGGGVSIKTKESNGSVVSHLYLASADADDSGVYSCGLEQEASKGNSVTLASAKLSLHILNGEEPAAIQSSGAVATTAHRDTSSSALTLLWLSSMLTLLYSMVI